MQRFQVFLLSFFLLYDILTLVVGATSQDNVVEDALPRQIYKPGKLFQRDINCGAVDKLTVVDFWTRRPLDWICAARNGKLIYGYIPGQYRNGFSACVKSGEKLCECFQAVPAESRVRIRRRRSVTDIYPAFGCSATTRVTKGEFALEVTFSTLSTSQQNDIKGKVATFFGVSTSQVYMGSRNKNIYLPHIENPNYIASWRSASLVTLSQVTTIEYLIACSDVLSTDSRVTKLRNAVADSSLSQLVGYIVIAWQVVSGTLILPTTTSPSTTAPTSVGKVNLILRNTTFRVEYPIPANTFQDGGGGNTRTMTLYLYQSSGNELATNSWISLNQGQQKLNIYTSKAIYDQQPTGGYKFTLSAMDSGGTTRNAELTITLNGPVTPPNYLRTLVLSSTTSVIVTSYKDVDVLFLLQNKMASYLNINAENMVNSVFTLTRNGNTALSIRYQFSQRSLVGTACDVASIISLRSKLVGSTAQENFKKILGPQFTVNSMSGESFTLACGHLSSAAATSSVSSQAYSIQVGQYFSYSVAQSSFQAPAGSTMRLRLELRFQNNTKIPSNYWIGLSGEYLDQNAVIQGLASLSVAKQETSHNFKLVVLTPVLVETTRALSFGLPTTPSITKVLFGVSLTQNAVVSNTYIAFSRAFLSYMSSYLSVTQSSIIIINYKVTTTTTTVSWTISSLSHTPCNTAMINETKQKLQKSEGVPNDALRNGLSTAANFAPTSISIKLSGVCDPPTVNYKIPTLYIPQYGPLTYQVPRNAFQDGSDGNNLTLHLLEQNGQAISSTSWIWFNSSSRVISGFPFSVSTIQTFNYILRAFDSEGISAEQNVVIQLNWTPPTRYLAYLVHFSYSQSLLPVSNVITAFITSLKTYFGQPSLNNLIIFQTPVFFSNNKIRLYYQNTTLRTDVCDVNGHLAIMDKLRKPSSQTVPNANFIAAMQPLFGIEEVGVQFYGKCIIANRNAPVFNIQVPEALNFFRAIKYVEYCGAASYLVPEKQFYDEEEGSTRNLKLTLLDADSKPLPKSSWVNINSTSQTIYAVADDTAYKQGTSYEIFQLIATDSDNKYETINLKFAPVGAQQVGYYNITMHLNVRGIANEPNVLQITPLLDSLKRLFPNGPNIHVRSYRVSESSAATSTAILIWSPCNMTKDTCNSTAIRVIREAVFTAGTKSMSANVNQVIDQRFQVTSVSESLSGPCYEEGPVINVPIPTLNIGFCGPFSYKIPSNTFMDKQDGGTEKLSLKLVKSNGGNLESDFWLQFDSSKQLITAVLTQEQNVQSYPKQHSFILIATDSTKISSNLTVNVVLTGTMAQYSHTFSIQTRATLPSSSHLLYTFAIKLAAYLGDTSKSFQAITQNAAANNKWIITWSNCSLRYDPCDVLGLKQIKEKLLNSYGTLQTSFQQALAPEFTDLFLSETNLGPCQTNRPPTVAVPFGPISVTTCQTYRAKIPEGTFNDYEQGNTRNLDLSLKNNQYNWVSFDSAKQEIMVLATNQIAASLASVSVTVVLAAADQSKQEARQNLVIRITQQPKQATQKITMQYRFRSLPSVNDFVSTYETVRNSIIQYFSSTNLLTSVEYATLPVSLPTDKTLNAEWSSCSLPRDSCDSNTLNKMAAMVVTGTTVNSAFKTALQQNIDVINVTFSRNGLCKDHITPPVVQNPLPTLTIRYCGYLAYRIPENTFYDNIDGDTRKLTLSLLTTSNQPVTASWIDFNTQTQTLRVVLADDSLIGRTTPTTLNYKIKATTKRGISVTTDLKLQLNQNPPNVSISVKLNFIYTASNPPSRNEILSSVLDRYAAYFNSKAADFHYVSIQQETSSQPYFITQIANCSLPQDRCDEQIFHETMRKINTKTGMQPAFLSAMGSDLLIQYAQILRRGPCDKTNVPPIVIRPPGSIQVYRCSDFNYTVAAGTFHDEEDAKLSLSVTRINGLPVSGNYRWVRFISSGYILSGIVTDKVLKNQPAGGYNLTIRATDSGGLYAETFLIVKIIGEVPQAHYQFSLQLTSNSLREQFMEERDIVRILNSYFNSNFTNIVSYGTASSTTISVKSSICTLPEKCDESAASSYFRQIITSQNTVPPEIARQFSPRYTLVSTAVYRDQICQGPLNPPVPTIQTWVIQGSYCGGFNQLVPADLFKDPEDGNTRNLKLKLYLNTRTPVPSSYWVQLNKTSQVIYGWPTRETTTTYTTSTVITLVAVDKTGQEGSVKIQFSFTQHQEPKYIYKIIFRPSQIFSSTLDETRNFAKALQLYLRDSSASSVGLIEHIQTSSGTHFFNYANCSVSYNPCDIVALNNVKNMLFTSTYLAIQAFKDAMQPAFSVNYGQVQTLSPCSGTTNNPPQVKTRITTIYISFCGPFTFRVPANTFYDTEEGDTRKLSLSLVDDSNRQLSTSSWIQFDTTSQTMTAFATVTSAASQPTGGYSFILTATDSSKLSASNAFKTVLYGPLQPLRDCQIQITFNADASLSGSTNNALSQIALNGLTSYFNLSPSEIGFVNLIRQSNTQFTFAWSYCSPSYTKYISKTSSTSQSIPVDYKGLVTKILIKLFKADRKTVQTAFYSAFSRLTVQSVKTVFTGSCANIPPVIPHNITQLSFTVANCGYRKEAIQTDLFYDYEDGYTFSLKLSLLRSDFIDVGIESWVNIDTASKSLLMSQRDMQRLSSQTDFEFYLQAMDSNGKNATLPMKIRKLSSATTMSPFNITFEFTVAKHITTEMYVNESIVLSDVTAQLYALNNGQSIITRQYSGQSGPADSRSFTWVTCSYQQCSTSAVLQTTKQLLRQSLNVFTTFKQAFQNRLFTLKRAYYISSCNTPVFPPTPTTTTIEFNITMCSPFKYQLAFSTFYDSEDGEINNMRVRLLDNNKRQLTSSSWIQLNTATLELYAIYQSSMLSTSSMTSSSGSTLMTSSSVTSSNQPLYKTTYFQLEATNSQGLKAYKQLKVNVLNYPYTSDCFATLSVKRNFGPSSAADLDVLYKLVHVISNFYGDTTVKIKISKFQKISEFAYTLKFSNCSFAFSTMKAAKSGLTESHRSAVTAIFSRMTNSDGSAKTSFSSHLSSNGFTLTSIQTSYSCIEEPPYHAVKSRRAYAFLCREFKDFLPYDLFRDKRDGNNLAISLHYTNGKQVSPSEWVQYDPKTHAVYGTVTRDVKLKIPSFRGYSYLLVATDSSGRSANMTYEIKIANAAPVTDVKFVLGFTSTFTAYSRTADIFLNITRKLGQYIDGNALGNNILIDSYHAMHLLTWENCTMRCDPTATTRIMQKLQKTLYESEPSAAFIAAMGPEITPTYIYVNGPKCLPTKNETIVVTYRIIIRKPMCGFFSHTIPTDAFRTSSGQTTRDLFLTMTTSTGGSLSSSAIINFHTALQQIEGVPVYTRLSSSMSYRLTATSSRSLQPGATTTVRVEYQDYSSYTKMRTKLCSIKTTVTTTYNPDFSDVYILKKFIQKVSKYFNSNTQQVQIISYSRSDVFPVRFTITFSNCTWISLLQTQTNIHLYYQSVSSMLRKVFTYSGTIITGFKQTFANSLQPDFNLISITSNTTTCTQPPDKPPQPNEPLTRVTAASCGEFNYQIPPNFFSDEDGGTRALNVEFLASDRSAIKADSWLVYDNKTQTISGLPLNETLANQPRDGYSYVVKATDSTGKSGYASLIIKIDGQPYPQYSDKELTLTYQTAIESAFQMAKILAITRKVSTFRTINDPMNRLRVMVVSFLPLSRISIKLVNCTKCNPLSSVKFSDLARSQRIQFNQHMKPEFPIAYWLSASGICKPGSEGIANKTDGVVHNVTFCSATRLNFLQTLSVNQLESGTKLAVRGVDFKPLPVNSWFWFNETSNILEAFSNEASWQSQPANGTAFTWGVIDTATGRRVSAFMEDRLKIVGAPTSSGLQYNLTIDTTISSTNVDAYFISIAFNAMQLYLGRNDLQFVSLTRQIGSSLRLSILFRICGLPSDCTTTGVKELDNKIFESPGKLRPQFISIFPNGFNVVSVTDNCKNQPPIIPRSLNITVPICGLYRYRIPSNFASDFEDGNAENLIISLRTADNLQLPRDSWIRFDENSREIYVLPTESVVRTPKPSGWRFIIVVKDKGGKQAQTGLNVFISNDIESYYSLSISFETVNTAVSTNYLNIQIRFLTMTSTYFSEPLSRYRLLTFAKSGTNGPNSESFFIRFGNCSVTKHMCLNNETSLTTTFQAITSAANNPSSQFAQYISQYFKIVSAKSDSLFTIDKPPTVLNGISVVRLDHCGMLVKDVPAATFYDEEQGTTKKLETSFTFINNTIPSPTYWMQLINNKMYIVPYGKIKSGMYKMKLSAKDHCGQIASTTVTVILTEAKSQSFYTLNMAATTKTTATTTSYPVYYIAALKTALKDLFADSEYHTRVTIYSREQNFIRMKWNNCTVPCDKEEIGKIKNKVFLAYNIVNPQLSSKLRPYYNVTSITEEISKNCTIPPTLPPVANQSLSVQVKLCRKLDFSVPANTFYDPEDGGTRSLSLSLLTESKQALSVDSWVQLDRAKQIIYGYPRIGNDAQFQRVYKYLLVASDKEGNSASTPVRIEIVGDLPPVLYQLSLLGQTTLDNSLPNVAQEISLIAKIGGFFGDYAINDVSYSRNGNAIQFSWSFCSMQTEKCDCYKIQEIRQKITPLVSFQQYLKPEFTVTSRVTEQLHGVCANTRNPELRYDRNELIVPPGQTFTYDIRNDKFYDFEDGYTRNLTLYATDSSNYALDNSAWLKVQNYKICGIMSLYRLEQMGWLTTTTTTREYKVVARDRCGKETRDSFLVRLKKSVPQLGYKLIVYLGNSVGGNCTKMERFVTKISKYIKTDVSFIYVYNYTSYNATNNASVIAWGLRNITERNCRNDTIKVIRERFLLDDDRVDPKFVDYMKPDYEVIDVKDDKSGSCSNVSVVIIPPVSPGGFPWWILILLLIIALLILLCCLCWICIPRCCPGCCGKYCGCCGKCCRPGGKYASLEDADGVGGFDDKDPKAGLGSPNDEEGWDYTADDDMIKQDIESDGEGVGGDYGDDGIGGEDYGDDGIGGEDYGDDGIGGDMMGDDADGDGFMSEDVAGDETSVTGDVKSRFGQDDSASQFSGISEVQMNTGTVPLAETTPITFDDSPPPSIYPPLYSSVVKDRRSSRLEDTEESMSERNEDDRLADVLSKPLTAPDDGETTMAMNSAENEADSLTQEYSEDDMQSFDRYDQGPDLRPQFQPGSDVTMDQMADDREKYSTYDQSSTENELSFESTTFQETTPYDELMGQRRLPRPSIDYVDTMPVLNTNDTTQYESSAASEMRRSSETFTNKLPIPADYNNTSFDESSTASETRRSSETFMNKLPMPADYNNTRFDERVTRNSESRRSSESYNRIQPVPGQEISLSGPTMLSPRQVSPFPAITGNTDTRRSSQSFSEERNESFRQSDALVLPGTQQPSRQSLTRPVEIKVPRSAFTALQGENFNEESRVNENSSYSVERRQSAGSEFSDFDNFLDKRATIRLGDTEKRRQSLGSRSFESFAASPQLRIRRRSAPLLDDDSSGFEQRFRRSSSALSLANDQYFGMPSSENRYRQNLRSSLGQREGFSTTERRSSRSFVSEEFTNDNGRRVSVVETVRDSPSGITRRKSTSQQLLTDATSSLDEPIKMKLGNEEAYRLLKRGSIQLEDGQLRSDGRRTSQASYSEGYFGGQERGSFRPSLTSEGLVQERFSSSSVTQKNRASKPGRARRVSRVREVNSKQYQFEMGPRGSQSSYVNDAYDSDSFV